MHANFLIIKLYFVRVCGVCVWGWGWGWGGYQLNLSIECYRCTTAMSIAKHLGISRLKFWFSTTQYISYNEPEQIQNLRNLGNIKDTLTPFHPEFIKWTFPSSHLYMSIVEKRGVIHK